MGRQWKQWWAAAAAAGLLLGSVLPASAAEETVRRYETAQPVTAVEVEAENADVVIQKGSGDTIRVDSAADAKGEYFYTCQVENGVLTVQVEAGEGEAFQMKLGQSFHGTVVKMAKNGRGVVWENEVTVTLPEKVYDQIQAVCNNGTITLENTESKESSLKTDNGAIALKHTESEEISLETVNGTIRLEGARGKNLTARVENGKILLDQPYALAYDCQVRNGNIEGTLAGTKADYRLEAKVRNGSNNLTDQAGTGAASARFQVTNGNIQVDFTG